MAQRKISRAEFDDSLLRNNVRHDNRLLHELQAVDKAQRVIAKTLDKETQWYRQKLASSSSSSFSASAARKKKRSPDLATSLYSGAKTGGTGRASNSPRLIPDYAYHALRQRSSTGTPPSSGESPEAGGPADLRDADVPLSKEDSARDKLPTQNGPQLAAKHTDSGSQVGLRTLQSEAGDKKTPSAGRRDERKSSEAGKHNPERRSGGSSSTDAPEADDLKLSRSLTTLTTEGVTLKVDARQRAGQSLSSPTTYDPLSSKPSGQHGNDQSGLQPLDATSPVVDVSWDGRRRYANVWDALSTPRHVAASRAVRDRLQREFSGLGERAARASSKQ